MTLLHTSSLYSSSKASEDLLVWSYHFPKKLISLMIVNALHDKSLPLYETGYMLRIIAVRLYPTKIHKQLVCLPKTNFADRIAEYITSSENEILKQKGENVFVNIRKKWIKRS